MQFALNEDQIAVRDMARDFAAEKIAPHAIRWDEEKHFPIGVDDQGKPQRRCNSLSTRTRLRFATWRGISPRKKSRRMRSAGTRRSIFRSELTIRENHSADAIRSQRGPDCGSRHGAGFRRGKNRAACDPLGRGEAFSDRS